MSSKPRRVEAPEQVPDRVTGRIPPQNLEAEQSVLGAVLLDNKSFFDLPPALRAEDFYFTTHRTVFAAMNRMLGGQERKPVDILTLTDELKRADELQAAGGAAYVAGLSNIVPSTANAAYYAKLVLDTAIRRRIAHACAAAIDDAHRDGISPTELQSRVEKLLAEADNGYTDSQIEDELDVIKRVMKRADESFDAETIRGFKTGLPSLDEAMFMNPTDLVILAGRPGNGKSVLASQIADHTGATMGPVLFISLEMRPDEVVTRRLMDIGSLTIDDVRKPRTQDAISRLVKACEELARRTGVRYFRARDPHTILRAATRLKRCECPGRAKGKHEEGEVGCAHVRVRAKDGTISCSRCEKTLCRRLRLLVIDYLQRCDTHGLPGDNRDQQIGYLTNMLKSWADDNEVPVLALSQLRRPERAPRNVSTGKPKPAPLPGLEDLRESGNIEADANAVLINHIPGLIEGTPQYRRGDQRFTQCIVAKQRNGQPRMIVELNAVFEHARFAEIPPEERAAAEEADERAAAEAEARDRKAKQKELDLEGQKKTKPEKKGAH